MKVEILELSENSAKFILSGADAAFANSLRRIMIGEVPKMAIDDVNIYENTSLLYDEILAHRLALIPLKTDLNSYVPREECKCEGGCSLCQVSLTLSVEGPKTVYSGDLVSSDPKIVPADGKIPIVRLKQGQRIVLEAIARLGKGKDHAKWQPTVACAYKNVAKITVSDECNGCGKCIDACPRKILEMRENRVAVKDEKLCSYCKHCMEVCEADAIHVELLNDVFLFSFETDGSLPAEEIILRACDILKSKAKEFASKVAKK